MIEMKYYLRRLANRISCGKWVAFRSVIKNKVKDEINNQRIEYSLQGDIGRKLYLYGEFEKNELEICRRYIKKTSKIIDIGANVGLHTVFFSKLATEGLVVSFEPQRSIFSILMENVRGLANVVPINLAISSDPGVAEFYVASDDAYSSLKDTLRKSIVSKIKVMTLPFDSFFYAFDSLDFVKIDVEGYEHEVLLSMKKTLEKHKPVLFVEIYAGSNSNLDPDKTVKFLKDLGYFAYFVDQDGELKKYESHNDDFYNYFFVHSSQA